MTGQELQNLLNQKWGYSYDVQLRRTPRKVFFQVMWRYLEQASFPMTEAEYWEHLDQVLLYLDAWGCTQQICQFIERTAERPRLGRAVSVPIDLGDRASEWLLSDR
ncbi:DUF3067 family protein [Romeria aff. gracilis LEGE 07310]|uniref:DUF3067 family protein n=1 Tax=Vasconcelosia minhoensis LEGE 07310 TaxID=915328 RepID=A0A8J7AVV8_9CYAN|nr:DUF3067 family protein [Romeria gracilis]MBE9080064.1 DUF3067 family protein [Romeria aff. gracilis LEGE 07310]